MKVLLHEGAEMETTFIDDTSGDPGGVAFRAHPVDRGRARMGRLAGKGR
jgi:hypothetical protein